MDRLGNSTVDGVFVIGGDADPPAGVCTVAGDVLEDPAQLEHPLARIGIGGCPRAIR